jgi:hypothetical protein
MSLPPYPSAFRSNYCATGPTTAQNEIERKFLVTIAHSFFQMPHVQIHQGYLTIDPRGAGMRLRCFGEQFSFP